MIIPLFKSKSAQYLGIPRINGFRWVLEVKSLFTGIVMQYRWDDNWYTYPAGIVGYGFSFVLNRRLFGHRHFYHDGNHCNFLIGPIGIHWNDDFCARCTKQFCDDLKKPCGDD